MAGAPPKPVDLPESSWPDCKLCRKRVEDVQIRLLPHDMDTVKIRVRCHGVTQERMVAVNVMRAAHQHSQAQMLMEAIIQCAEFRDPTTNSHIPNLGPIPDWCPCPLCSVQFGPPPYASDPEPVTPLSRNQCYLCMGQGRLRIVGHRHVPAVEPHTGFASEVRMVAWDRHSDVPMALEDAPADPLGREEKEPEPVLRRAADWDF
jgi:hypothetical protein